MIDPFKETMLPLGKAARNVPGRTVSPQTIYRWCSTGIDGVKLETLVVGGRMQTSEEAMLRFFSAVTEARQPPSRQDDSYQRPERVSRQLKDAGLV